MKDAVATMGGLLPDDAGGKDAVHVAVVSAIAGSRLSPGQHIGFERKNARGDVLAVACDKPIGIVDPFLTEGVIPDERFWLYLYPRTITGLQHQWSHPAFDGYQGAAYAAPSEKLTSEEWLKNFISSADCPDYHAVMAAAQRVADGRNDAWDGDYLHFDGSDAHGEIPPEFWTHVENVLGRKIAGQKPAYFSCSC